MLSLNYNLWDIHWFWSEKLTENYDEEIYEEMGPDTYQQSQNGDCIACACVRDPLASSSCPASPPWASDHAPFRHGPMNREPYLHHITKILRHTVLVHPLIAWESKALDFGGLKFISPSDTNNARYWTGSPSISLPPTIINLVKYFHSTEPPWNLALLSDIQVPMQVHRPIATIFKIIRLKQSTLLRLQQISAIQKDVKAEELHPRHKTWATFQNFRPTKKRSRTSSSLRKHERLYKP
jgi:hypothetical protein